MHCCKKNAAKSRSVLILAYGWPPDASVGAVRPVYLSRQLGRLGWHPIVITVHEQYHERLNTSNVSTSTDSTFVIRTRCLPNPRHAYLWIKKLLARVHCQQAIISPDIKTNDMSTHDRQKVSKTKPGLMRRTILSLLHTPDEYQGWFPFALTASLLAIVRHRPQCVISTAPPFTSHLVAFALKKICGINWIADYRDPWSCNENRNTEIISKISDWINRSLDTIVISCADRVVCVTPSMTEKYRELYPSLPDNKWITITNGYDLDEFVGLDPAKKMECFTISYVGNFSYNRTPQLLLRAVSELIVEGKLDRHKLNLRFVGSSQFAGGRSITEMIAENNLDGVVEIVGFVPRKDALKEILRANVLLLVGTQNLTVAAKTYEYMAARKPILAIVEEGAEADLIRHSGAGVVVSPDDLDGVKRAITYWYQESLKEDGLGFQQSPYGLDRTHDYSWEILGARYSSVLEDCLGVI